MDILIYDRFQLKDICARYEMVKHERFFRGIGAFEIKLNSIDEGKKFEIDNWIMIKGDLYIVENIHKYKNSNKSIIFEITGRSIKSILERRVVIEFILNTNTSYEKACNDLVKNNFVTSNVSDKNIDFVICDTVVDTNYPDSNFTYHNMTVAECLNRALSNKKLGYDIVMQNNKLIFKILQYRDLRDSVLFSEEFGNVSESDYYKQTQDYKNVCYCVDSETSQITVVGNGTGYNRKEMIIEGEYNGELEDLKIIESSQCDLVETDMYKYKTDYDIGSIVTFYDKTLNISAIKQINQVTETIDTLETIEINIGDFVPNVFQKILKKR